MLPFGRRLAAKAENYRRADSLSGQLMEVQVGPLAESGNRFGDGKHLVGFGAHANVFREVRPAHGSGAIYQELSRPRYLVASGAAANVKQIVPANGFRIRIGKEREGIACFAAELLRLLGTVNADRDRKDTGIVELYKIFLYASQLEVTERSPVTAIEDQQHCFRSSA